MEIKPMFITWQIIAGKLPRKQYLFKVDINFALAKNLRKILVTFHYIVWTKRFIDKSDKNL